MRIATLDIETTSLDASYGRLLCACFKFTDESSPRTIVARRYKDEPRALEKIAKLYREADIIVTWNGKKFDIPFLNARIMVRRDELKLDPPILDPMMKHIDLMYMSAKLRTRGNRLDGAAKDLKARNQKYHCVAEDWVRAADGHKPSLDGIIKHCEVDVLITEDMLNILKPHIIRITK